MSKKLTYNNMTSVIEILKEIAENPRNIYKENEKLRAELAAARDALEFYRDKVGTIMYKNAISYSPIGIDQGRRAATAIARIDEYLAEVKTAYHHPDDLNDLAKLLAIVEVMRDALKELDESPDKYTDEEWTDEMQDMWRIANNAMEKAEAIAEGKDANQT